jgi:TolB-like protein/Tfp pilus assembly protein PilF
MTFMQELKHRNVLKVGVGYAVIGFLVLQISKAVSHWLGWSDWLPDLVLVIVLAGFVPALILAWAFEITPKGIRLHPEIEPGDVPVRKKKGRKLDYTLIILFGLAFGYSVWESGYEQRAREYRQTIEEAERAKAEFKPRQPRLTPEFMAVEENSIAALPFTNLSSDPADLYFTDGIHEDLLIHLSRIDALSVISRGSVMEYRNTAKNIREIATELSVANIIEGSVQRMGDRVRINVQLIDADTDAHLWAEIYDRELTTTDLFSIQSEIARSIAGALEATLTDSELADVNAVPTDDVAAYDFYLKARQAAQHETRDSYELAIDRYREALTLDPQFKQAWIGLARAYMTNYWVFGGDTYHVDRARTAIEKAREIDPEFPELHIAEGFYHYWAELDYDRALYSLSKAIERMPGNDEAYMWRGWVSRRAGLWKQAVTSMQSALKLNPRVHFNWHEYALTLLYLHRYDEAREAAMQARELAPDSLWGKTTLAQIGLQESGDTETALALTEGGQNTNVYDFYDAFMRANVLAGRLDVALEAARNYPDELERQRNRITLRESWTARVLWAMGRQDEAMQSASAALFRLKTMSAELGDDYRIDLAEAVARTLQGAEPAEIVQLIERSRASKPVDDLEDFRFRTAYARMYAAAGMADEAIELLNGLLSPPSEISVPILELDPAYDRIREHPGFVALLENDA